MGYTTNFSGGFSINKRLDRETIRLLEGLSSTRRVQRDINILAKIKKITLEKAIYMYGPNAEYYFENTTNTTHGTEDESITDYNKPPAGQPGLWCDWKYDEYSNIIKWNGSEKFYNYVEWIKYLVEKILKPRGYTLTGSVDWRGEDEDDIGTINIFNNEVSC